MRERQIEQKRGKIVERMRDINFLKYMCSRSGAPGRDSRRDFARAALYYEAWRPEVFNATIPLLLIIWFSYCYAKPKPPKQSN